MTIVKVGMLGKKWKFMGKRGRSFARSSERCTLVEKWNFGGKWGRPFSKIMRDACLGKMEF